MERIVCVLQRHTMYEWDIHYQNLIDQGHSQIWSAPFQTIGRVCDDAVLPHYPLVLVRTIGNSCLKRYSDVIMSAMASQIIGVSIAYSTVCSGTDQRKHQSSVSLAFVRGISHWPVNSLHKEPVTRKIFPFDDVIIRSGVSKPALDYLFYHMTVIVI